MQNDISVLHSKFETLVSKMLLIQEQNQTIMSQMLPILKRIDERTQGKREGFSSEVKKKFVSCVSTLYSGKCPCCHRVDIAKNGKPIPYAGEHDHYHHRSMNRIEHGWFVCKSCNNKLKNRKPDGFWFLAGPAFQQFQRLIHEGDGPQMFLTFDSVDPNEPTLFQSPKPKV
jgi:hypothetical protein